MYPSTSRGNEPHNLKEQMALDAAKDNPLSGKSIDTISMKDPRMPYWLGWKKMLIKYPKSSSFPGFEVHYVRNRFTGTSFDYKIK